MTAAVPAKHQRIVATLAEEIRAGRLPEGSRLPGEHALTERFAVSRTTVRQALRALSEQGLIATRAGIGSVVTFDGAPLDDPRGWAAALAGRGIRLTTRTLRLEAGPDPALAARLGLDPAARFLHLDRVRTLPDGLGVSLELSRSRLVPELAEVPRTGLVEDSLRRTLTAAGLFEAGGRQSAEVAPLPAAEARSLGRAEGEVFLKVERTSRDAEERLVEHVTSWLAPEHFRLELTF
ncbi:GntR family transcriptional regulator [Actinacidiphila acidipaludis]|uniref:GntR family transcriptional regulator n=1 Tax=Actinacidiphila acidipaludis TaxID=2873382 RepID=A0ABS7Q0P3_9ACTN|nr:GntR family transcriptional regulator [Streptomyces acidipaludis]MBY8876319.1 GntR family transcriptional regulator [Streptomyces acidipaludis]